MTITTTEEFCRIGIEDGKQMRAEDMHLMVFEPVGGKDHVAYLEGMIQGLRSQIIAAEAGDDTLRLEITRELEAKEIAYMVFGTGALSYPWWGNVTWISVTDGGDFPLDVRLGLDNAEPTDVIIITHDGADSPEGSMDTQTRLTFREIAAAVGTAVMYGYAYEQDAIQEDLGMLDAEQADTVLQLAVFGGTKPVFG